MELLLFLVSRHDAVVSREEIAERMSKSGRVYANTFTGKAVRSDDYGDSWKAIQGYDFQWGHRVIVDENDPARVYITTYGSGIWHGTP